MFSFRYYLGISTLIILFSFSSFAQVRKGLNELNLSGSVNILSAEGESITTVLLQLAYGNFVTESLELGGNFSFLSVEDEEIGAVGAFLSIHFPSSGSTAVPYIGGQFGAGFGLDDNPVTFGGYGGVKIFIGQGGGGALTIQGFYLRQNYDEGGINNYGAMMGISIFF